ncbi:MAG: ankyrin repeat domain-containing protein [Cocleimonas sp.]|nr:ankyrin repeat domain-containing protein [Cocleimonas sp.]
MKYVVNLAPLLIVLASQPALSATNNALELSEAEMQGIIYGNNANNETTQAKETIIQEKKVIRQRPQPIMEKQIIATAPTPIIPVVKRANSSSIPAWRKPASPTMTRSSDDALFGAAKSKNMNLLRKLLLEGANVNHQNFNGESPLHIAASLGNLQMVQYLIKKGANVNSRTGTLWTPLHHAMRFDHPRVANYLIAHKVALGQKTIDGFTAFDFAKKSNNAHIKALARKHTH